MAKKDPTSPEWLSRCVDIVTAFSDGSRERDGKPGWTLYLTLPPYSDLKAFGSKWRGLGENVAQVLTDNNVISEVLVSEKNNPRTQYFITQEGNFSNFEDYILNHFENMFGPIMGEQASSWKAKLEQSRPSMSCESPGKLASELEKAYSTDSNIRPDFFSLYPDVKAAIAKTKTNPHDMSLLPALLAARNNIESSCPEKIQDLASCIDGILNYKNSMRMKMEIWTERAFIPMSAPYLANLFKSQSGDIVSFNNPSDYFRKLSQQVFGEEFSKSPRMTLESAGIFNSKTFPVSPFRLRTVNPQVSVKDHDVILKTGWLQSRLHWKLQNALVTELVKTYGSAVSVFDSKKNTKTKYPDPFGVETINTLQVTIKTKSIDEATRVAVDVGSLVDSLYVKDHAPATGRFAGVDTQLRQETDIISEKVQEVQETKLEKKQNMKVENRIVPYAAKAAVYIQVADKELMGSLNEAINETLVSRPEWNIVPSVGSNYASIHLNAPRTGEACGLAERSIVAAEVSKRYKDKTGQDDFAVRYPDSGYKVEVSRRKINPMDKNDESAGIYIKIPSAFSSGGLLEEKFIEDESFADTLDDVSKGFCLLNEEFGRGAKSKSILKLCTPASSQMEIYTKTWLYKIKPQDDEEAKIKEIKTAVEERVTEFFTPEVPIILDWMPDRSARKLETINNEIDVFALKWIESCGSDILENREPDIIER